MRLSRLDIHGFRAFPDEQSFDLDAGVILLSGPNGQGKTSILDAILWCLAGCIPRLGNSLSDIVSLYSDTGEAEVTISAVDSVGQQLIVTRACDRQSMRLRVRQGDNDVVGIEARDLLRRFLWPGGTTDSRTNDGSDLKLGALGLALTRSVYLQQDLVSQFVDADDERARFDALGELFGTGRVVDLQVELERQKASWTKSTNTLGREEVEFQDKIVALDGELRRLTRDISGRESDVESEWADWWKTALALDIHRASVVAPDSAEAPRDLDSALKELEALRASTIRNLLSLEQLLVELEELLEIEVPKNGLETVAQKVKDLERHLGSLRKELASNQEKASRQRYALVIEQEKEKDYAVFAKLALYHLEKRCPVCRQEYDVEKTRSRLESLSGEVSEPEEITLETGIEQLAAEVRGHETELARQRKELVTLRETEGLRTSVGARLSDISVEADSLEDAARHVRARIQETRSRNDRVPDVIDKGERLSLILARAGEHARRGAVEQELHQVTTRLSNLKKKTRLRGQTGDSAQRIIEALRVAGQDIISRELKTIGPTLQDIYSAIDPHPALREVSLSSWMHYGHGHVGAVVRDPDRGIHSDQPQLVLSSSQVNALAVSVFLSLNLSARRLPLELTILDDPLQSLDDINLLGMVDVLRRLRDQRQLILSTHDPRFRDLLERKLRPVEDDQKTILINVDAWTRSGPTVMQRSIPTSGPLSIFKKAG